MVDEHPVLIKGGGGKEREEGIGEVLRLQGGARPGALTRTELPPPPSVGGAIYSIYSIYSICSMYSIYAMRISLNSGCPGKSMNSLGIH